MKKLAKLLVLVVIALTLVGCQKKENSKNFKPDVRNIWAGGLWNDGLSIIYENNEYLYSDNGKDFYKYTFVAKNHKYNPQDNFDWGTCYYYNEYLLVVEKDELIDCYYIIKDVFTRDYE